MAKNKWVQKYKACGCPWCQVTLMPVALTTLEHDIRMSLVTKVGSSKCKWK